MPLTPAIQTMDEPTRIAWASTALCSACYRRGNPESPKASATPLPQTAPAAPFDPDRQLSWLTKRLSCHRSKSEILTANTRFGLLPLIDPDEAVIAEGEIIRSRVIDSLRISLGGVPRELIAELATPDPLDKARKALHWAGYCDPDGRNPGYTVSGDPEITRTTAVAFMAHKLRQYAEHQGWLVGSPKADSNV
jgi:hypothetical protein